MNFILSRPQAEYLDVVMVSNYKLIPSEEYFLTSSDEEEPPIPQPVPPSQSPLHFVFSKLKSHPTFLEIAVMEPHFSCMKEIETQLPTLPFEEFDQLVRTIIKGSDPLMRFYSHSVQAMTSITYLNTLKQHSFPPRAVPTPEEPERKFSPRDRLGILKSIQKLSKSKYRRAFDLLRGRRTSKLSVEIRKVPSRVLESLIKLTNHTKPMMVDCVHESEPLEEDQVVEERESSSQSGDSFTSSSSESE